MFDTNRLKLQPGKFQLGIRKKNITRCSNTGPGAKRGGNEISNRTDIENLTAYNPGQATTLEFGCALSKEDWTLSGDSFQSKLFYDSMFQYPELTLCGLFEKLCPLLNKESGLQVLT